MSLHYLLGSSEGQTNGFGEHAENGTQPNDKVSAI